MFPVGNSDADYRWYAGFHSAAIAATAMAGYALTGSSGMVLAASTGIIATVTRPIFDYAFKNWPKASEYRASGSATGFIGVVGGLLTTQALDTTFGYTFFVTAEAKSLEAGIVSIFSSPAFLVPSVLVGSTALLVFGAYQIYYYISPKGANSATEIN